MTAEQRMILHRHHAAYQQWGTSAQARSAAIRIALAIGISQAEAARELGVSARTVWGVVNGQRECLTRLQIARQTILRAERTLSMARGWEKAALERAARYGYPIPEGLAQDARLRDAAGKSVSNSPVLPDSSIEERA